MFDKWKLIYLAALCFLFVIVVAYYYFLRDETKEGFTEQERADKLAEIQAERTTAILDVFRKHNVSDPNGDLLALELKKYLRDDYLLKIIDMNPEPSSSPSASPSPPADTTASASPSPPAHTTASASPSPSADTTVRQLIVIDEIDEFVGREGFIGIEGFVVSFGELYHIPPVEDNEETTYADKMYNIVFGRNATNAEKTQVADFFKERRFRKATGSVSTEFQFTRYSTDSMYSNAPHIAQVIMDIYIKELERYPNDTELAAQLKKYNDNPTSNFETLLRAELRALDEYAAIDKTPSTYSAAEKFDYINSAYKSNFMREATVQELQHFFNEWIDNNWSNEQFEQNFKETVFTNEYDFEANPAVFELSGVTPKAILDNPNIDWYNENKYQPGSIGTEGGHALPPSTAGSSSTVGSSTTGSAFPSHSVGSSNSIDNAFINSVRTLLSINKPATQSESELWNELNSVVNVIDADTNTSSQTKIGLIQSIFGSLVNMHGSAPHSESSNLLGGVRSLLQSFNTETVQSTSTNSGSSVSSILGNLSGSQPSEDSSTPNMWNFLSKNLDSYYKPDSITTGVTGAEAPSNALPSDSANTIVDTSRLINTIMESTQRQLSPDTLEKTLTYPNTLAKRQGERNRQDLTWGCERGTKYLRGTANDEDMTLIPELVHELARPPPPACYSTRVIHVEPQYDQSALIGTALEHAADTQVGSILPRFEYRELLPV